DDLARLQKTVRSAAEREATTKLAAALDDYWRVFNVFKLQDETDSQDLPANLTVAIDHLQAQTEVLYEAVKGSMKEQVAFAADVGRQAERVTRLAGIFAGLLGIVVSVLIVHSINDPLRCLTKGTRAIAKGQFWHRLPAYGNDEFTELARDFNVMTEKLGQLDQMKKDFVSHVSHDLKAPLASIRQIMHLLLQEIPGSLNEQQKGLIQLSYNSAERLAAMVGNLLDVSRMEAGTMEYTMSAQDIVQMIKGVIDEFDVQAREKEIRLLLKSAEPATFVECDRERII